MTSVRKRGPPWRWRGCVTPAGAATGSGAGAVGSATGRRWGKLGRLMLTSGGLSHHVQRSGASGPDLKAPRALADEDLETVDAPAAPALGLPQELGAAVPIHQVDHARVFLEVIGVYRDLLERLGRVVQADRCAVDEHLRRPPRLDRRDAEIGREAPGALGAAIPDEDLGAGAAQRVRRGSPAAAPARPRARGRGGAAAAGGRPPAPSTSAVRGAGSPRASRSPGASVLSARIAPSGPNVSVFAAPIARASSEASSARASAASLCGIVTLTPANPCAGSPRTVCTKSSGETVIGS